MRTLRLAGFATRALGLAIDAGIINIIVALIGFVIALGLGLFDVDLPQNAFFALIGTAGYVLFVALYFESFWTLTGQTPGMRFMGIRVITRHGGVLTRHCAARRVLGMFLAALPLGAGFLLVLFDSQRRGLHDRMARTLVVHVGELEPEKALAPL